MGPGSVNRGHLVPGGRDATPANQRVSGMPRCPLLAWGRSGLAVGLVGVTYAGFGMVSRPANPLPRDAYRYVEEIEREFAGLPADKVLLDLGGAWLPARKGIVTRDSAPSSAAVARRRRGWGIFRGSSAD